MNKRSLLTVITVVLISHLLLFNANWGLNILLVDVLLVASLKWLKPAVLQDKSVRFLLGSLLLSSLFVVLHDSLLAKLTHTLFFLISIGFCHGWRPQLWFLGLFQSFWALPSAWFYSIWHKKSVHKKTTTNRRWFRNIGMAVIPIIIAIIFYSLYRAGNTDFNAFHLWASEKLNPVLQFDLAFNRVFHLLLIALPIFALLQYTFPNPFKAFLSKKWPLKLLRERNPNSSFQNALSLKWEYQIGVLTFLTLNVILLLLNGLDLWNVWISPEEKTAAQLSKFVHAGTWALMFSILLAMILVLYFFRKNQHFYPQSRLRQLAKIWIIQNVFLAASVACRNGHYIAKYGLAEGRIIVLFFLILVFYGLWTMFQKLTQQKSIFYLVHRNSWAFLVVLLLASSVNWSVAITRYNLALINKNEMDYNYLSTGISGQNLFLLLDEKMAHQSSNNSAPFYTDKKTENVLLKQEAGDWRSWNYSHYRNYKALKKHGLHLSED